MSIQSYCYSSDLKKSFEPHFSHYSSSCMFYFFLHLLYIMLFPIPVFASMYFCRPHLNSTRFFLIHVTHSFTFSWMQWLSFSPTIIAQSDHLTQLVTPFFIHSLPLVPGIPPLPGLLPPSSPAGALLVTTAVPPRLLTRSLGLSYCPHCPGEPQFSLGLSLSSDSTLPSLCPTHAL